MTTSRTSSLKTYILVGLLVILSSAGNLFFSIGMKRIGALHGWGLAALHSAFVAIFTSVWVWLGIVSMLLFLASLMLVLSWADFTYVLPATAAMYAVTPLLGHFALGEDVTGLRWVGVALICTGVVFVGRTPPNTTKKD
jgi:drug/metabolite transporter (DMT)-like permease